MSAPPAVVPGQRSSSTVLSAGERALIRVRGVYIGAATIMSIFLGLYLFHVGGVVTVATFYSTYYVTLTLGFVLAGRILRTGLTRTVMRLGAVLLCAVYLLLVLLGPSAATYAALMGALAGLGEGLFWAGHNLTEYRVTHWRTRSIFFGKSEFVSQVAATVGPPVAGVVLTLAALVLPGENRYFVLFGLLTVVLLLVRHSARSLPEVGGVEFRVSDVCRVDRTPGWSLVLAQNVARGLWMSVTGVFTPIVIFMVVQGELAVSVFAAVTTILSACGALLAGRMLHRRPSAHLVGAGSVPVGLLALAWGQSWLAIAAFVLLVSCLDHFARIGMANGMYTVMDAGGHAGPAAGGGAYHLFVQREVALNGGRVLSFLLVLWLCSTGDQMTAVATGLALIAPMPLVGGLLQWRLDRAVTGGASPAAAPTPPVAAEPLAVAA